MPEPNAEANVADRIANTVAGRAGVKLAYGDPVVGDGITVVPVARVRFGFGGGGGEMPSEKTAEVAKHGGGGGGGAVVSPVGFLIIRGEAIEFRAIRDPARLIGLVLAIAFGIGLALRGVARLRRLR
jgi:uncharacterized spore protein YtfJ